MIRPSVNDENMLPYQPGMLLNDRPPMYNSDSEYEGAQDGAYSFGEVRGSQNHEVTAIKLLLQQQQALMTSILANQEEIKGRQVLYEQRVTKIEENMVQHSPLSSSDGSPSAGRKRKRIVNRGISISVA